MLRYSLLALTTSAFGMTASIIFHMLNFSALASNFILGSILCLYILENLTLYHDYHAHINNNIASLREQQDKRIEHYIQRLKLLTEEAWSAPVSDIACYEIQRNTCVPEPVEIQS